MSDLREIVITSDYTIDDLDSHFKVSAGPGAGKTYWLVNHIKNVLRRSTRLNRVSKIASISYTNVASKHIKQQLGEDGDRVECSTIHSFLYSNILQPYAYLVKNDLKYQEMDGHERHVPSYPKLEEWLQQYSGIPPKNQKMLLLTKVTPRTKLDEFFIDLSWQFNGNEELILQPTKRIKALDIKFPVTKVKAEAYSDYKKLYWREGVVHHEDVLYFSYRILKEYPLLKDFLSAKFPYIFVDEFQDTNPIQTKIVSWLGEAGSTIGIIGDIAQSIYQFQGATPQQFQTFYLDGQQNYRIEDNWRSTDSIIHFLGQIREGFSQNRKREDSFDYPVVGISGSNHSQNIQAAIEHIKTDLGKSKIELKILARKHDLVTQVRRHLDQKPVNVWQEVEEIDRARKKFLFSLMTGMEYARQERFDDAIIELLRVFKKLKNPLTGPQLEKETQKGLALELLGHFLSQEALLSRKLIEFYNEDIASILENYGIKQSKVRGGRKKAFFESHAVHDLVDNLPVREDKGEITTIHNAKGAEFGAVAVCFEKEEDIDKHILKPKLDKEESPIYYVAYSRAKDFLILSFPSLTEARKQKLESLHIRFLPATTPAT